MKAGYGQAQTAGEWNRPKKRKNKDTNMWIETLKHCKGLFSVTVTHFDGVKLLTVSHFDRFIF
jgi:hypothetical protein